MHAGTCMAIGCDGPCGPHGRGTVKVHDTGTLHTTTSALHCPQTHVWSFCCSAPLSCAPLPCHCWHPLQWHSSPCRPSWAKPTCSANATCTLCRQVPSAMCARVLASSGAVAIISPTEILGRLSANPHRLRRPHLDELLLSDPDELLPDDPEVPLELGDGLRRAMAQPVRPCCLPNASRENLQNARNSHALKLVVMRAAPWHVNGELNHSSLVGPCAPSC